MSEQSDRQRDQQREEQAASGPTAALLADVKSSLALDSPATDDAGRIDRIRALEELKQAVCAAQAKETVRFKASQLAEQAAAGVRRRDLGKGISEQIALARRESPGRTSRLVALAETLTLDMPQTMRALTAGEVSEWRALKVATETAFLSPEDRSIVDSQLADSLASLSDQEAAAAARRLAYALDPKGFVSRGKKAHQDRHVSMRPAPDTMARFSALLPVAEGAALYAALSREADARRSAGDDRTRGQVMADTLVERVTGQSRADDVPVEVHLVMSDGTLFGFDDRPADLTGFGPMPGAMAREWVLGFGETSQRWLRRLYVDPVTHRVTEHDARRRLFPAHLRRTILIRDGHCRTPWCSAPIRHIDHPVPAAQGGETTIGNGQGLCEACNYAKEAPGWRVRPDPAGADVAVTVTTPTGHRYESRPPPLLVSDDFTVPRGRVRLPLDVRWESPPEHVAA
jgi:hypothetical protein